MIQRITAQKPGFQGPGTFLPCHTPTPAPKIAPRGSKGSLRRSFTALLTDLLGGGPGSGCHGDNCGRPAGSGGAKIARQHHKPATAGKGTAHQALTHFGWEKVKRQTLKYHTDGKKPLEIDTVYRHPDHGTIHVYHIDHGGTTFTHYDKNGNQVYGPRDIGKFSAKLHQYLSSVQPLQMAPKPFEALKPSQKLDVESHLSTSGISHTKDLKPGEHVSVTKLITFTDGSKGVFKPASGEPEDMRKYIRHGQQTEREVGAWQVAKIVGMTDIGTPCIIRTINGERGALMEFKPGKDAADAANPFDGKRDMQRAALYDFVIGNTDRHQGNWLVDNQGKIHLIDHGLCFPESRRNDSWNQQFVRRAREWGGSDSDLKTLKQPFVENKAKIIEALRDLRLPDKAIRSVEHRINRVERARSWQDLDPRIV